MLVVPSRTGLVLVFSSVGYETLEIEVRKDSIVNTTLRETAKSLAQSAVIVRNPLPVIVHGLNRQQLGEKIEAS